MLRALPYYVLCGLCIFLMGFYMGNYQPQMMTDVLLRVDVFGWTHTVKAEKERLYQINNLAIPYEDKQVLVQHTVFIGATSEMVRLALGEPMKTVEKSPAAGGRSVAQLSYVYYLPEDKRPTIFIFADDKLVNACKGSALDVNADACGESPPEVR